MVFGYILMVLWLGIQELPHLALSEIPTPTYLQSSQVLYRKKQEWESKCSFI